jgi:hypothetical protein
MRFYVYLLLAFSLGWLVRPLFETDLTSDSEYGDFNDRLFRDPCD